MNLHEYQAKELFQRAGIPIAPGSVAVTPAEARAAAQRIGGAVVVKAQVHSGGRGKAGGVKLANTPEEAEEKARAILALSIQGLPVRKVLVTSAVDIASETYAAILVDRASKQPMLMLSAAGGIDIEEIAHTNPERDPQDPDRPRRPGSCRGRRARPCSRDRQEGQGSARAWRDILVRLYRVFWSEDASLAEINPLVVTKDGEVLALDAKVSIDDNALFRHDDLEAHARHRRRDAGLDPARARTGCRTCRSTATSAASSTARAWRWRRWTWSSTTAASPRTSSTSAARRTPRRSSPRSRSSPATRTVKAILFNIFGGITRCDDVARGILTALEQLDDRRAARDPPHRHERGARAQDPGRDTGLTATTSMDEGVQGRDRSRPREVRE